MPRIKSVFYALKIFPRAWYLFPFYIILLPRRPPIVSIEPCVRRNPSKSYLSILSHSKVLPLSSAANKCLEIYRARFTKLSSQFLGYFTAPHCFKALCTDQVKTFGCSNKNILGQICTNPNKLVVEMEQLSFFSFFLI